MPRVLVVDDNPDFRTTVAEILGEEGFAVDAAQNGHEALELLRTRRADVILLDVVMPEMDGHEFMAQLRRDPSLAAIPVVVSTAAVNTSIEGAAAWLAKPFEVEQMLEAIRRCLPPPP